MLNDPNSPFNDLMKALIVSIEEEGFKIAYERIRSFLKRNVISNKNEREEPEMTLKVLRQTMGGGSLPKIAVVGMTSTGKSSLVNALFGLELLKVNVNPDTTKGVFRMEYRNGLIIYDTPGLFGEEKYPHHNRTRVFLGLKQDNDYAEAEDIPFEGNIQKPFIVEDITPDNVKEYAPITLVIWVVNVSRTLTGPDRKACKSFFEELETHYEGRLVVAGTHLDVLETKPFDEADEMLERWADISGGQLIPLSSTTKKSLDQLVLALFSSLPDGTSLAKLQDSLVNERKLKRRSFIVMEVSKILTSIILCNGDKQNQIRAYLIIMFALLCQHYSVDEKTWNRYNGNMHQIFSEVQPAGTYETRELHIPKGFFERLKFILGIQLVDTVTNYRRLGVDGLKQLLPTVYEAIYDFEKGPSKKALTVEKIQQIIQSEEDDLSLFIERNNVGRLTSMINQLLVSLFDSL